MRSAQFSLNSIVGIYRRRKKLLFFPAVIITVLCVVAAFTLPRKYESTTTILVQKNDIANPLLGYQLSVELAQEDRLSTFSQVIYSRPIITALIDSLRLADGVRTDGDRQSLVKAVQGNVKTDRSGSESFKISYVDTDPVRAQRAASLLTDLFIKANVEVENQRNELTVQFFEKKVEDFRQKFESSQRTLVSALQQRAGDMGTGDQNEESRILYRQLEEIERQMSDYDKFISVYEQELAILRTVPEQFPSDSGKQKAYELLRADVPFVGELRELLIKYEDYTKRYTAKYPDVQKLESQVSDVMKRMKTAIEGELAKQQNRRWDLERRRTQIVDNVRKSTITQRINQDEEATYGLYQKLYDEMKLKLEQARTTRDLGRGSASDFIIIDPALVPTEPSKPSRPLIILGGIAMGLIFGIFSIIIAEMFDTTIRVSKDIEVYQKPVIAFIPERSGAKN